MSKAPGDAREEDRPPGHHVAFVAGTADSPHTAQHVPVVAGTADSPHTAQHVPVVAGTADSTHTAQHVPIAAGIADSTHTARHVPIVAGTADSTHTARHVPIAQHGWTANAGGTSFHGRLTPPTRRTKPPGHTFPGGKKPVGSAKRRETTRILDVPWFRGMVTAAEQEAREEETRLMATLSFWHIPPQMFLPVVGKATIALYRSRVAVYRERRRIKAAGKFLIHPYSSFRRYWLLATAVLTVFNILFTPFGVAFFPDHYLMSADWLGFSICCDIVFLLDIILSFFTAFMKDHEQFKAFAVWFVVGCGFVTSGFAACVVACACDYSTHFARLDDPRAMERLHAYRIMSMLRLFRASRLVRFASYLEVVHDFSKLGLTSYMQLIYSCLMMILTWHWSSCCQFLIQRLAHFPEDCWVRDMAALNTSMEHQYVSSLFRTLSHVVSVGYATLFLPIGIQELWLTSMSMLILTALYVSILSRITALAFGSYGCTRVYKAKYEQCELYLANRRVPKDLQSRILGHLYIRFQGKWFDEEEILQDMSESLRKEVMFHNCHHLVRKVPWFKDANIITAIISELKFEVFQKDDIIFRNGSIGRKMYLIDAGVIALDDFSTQITITKGDYFGEYCLLGNRKRTCTAVALTACRLYALSLESFKKVQDQYPRLIEDVSDSTAPRIE
ncbi:potassium/sodium hyperpolarization-activated cyclic nucleotide-gated channel 4-like isoform X2 [Lissotriton helveticus]